jgi:hypothetical protein
MKFFMTILLIALIQGIQSQDEMDGPPPMDGPEGGMINGPPPPQRGGMGMVGGGFRQGGAIVAGPIVEQSIIERPVVVERPVIRRPVVVERPIVERPVIFERPIIRRPIVVERPVIVERPIIQRPMIVEEPMFMRRPMMAIARRPFFGRPAAAAFIGKRDANSKPVAQPIEVSTKPVEIKKDTKRAVIVEKKFIEPLVVPAVAEVIEPIVHTHVVHHTPAVVHEVIGKRDTTTKEEVKPIAAEIKKDVKPKRAVFVAGGGVRPFGVRPFVGGVRPFGVRPFAPIVAAPIVAAPIVTAPIVAAPIVATSFVRQPLFVGKRDAEIKPIADAEIKKDVKPKRAVEKIVPITPMTKIAAPATVPVVKAAVVEPVVHTTKPAEVEKTKRAIIVGAGPFAPVVAGPIIAVRRPAVVGVIGKRDAEMDKKIQ